MVQLLKVLVTVKTYPIPSIDYRETVCTAGVLEDGSFVRLYPVSYRYMPYWESYRKYQWIEVYVSKTRKGDKRPESYSPIADKPIKPGEFIESKDGWAERRKYVLAKGTQTMCHLNSLEIAEKSLGIVRPRVVKDFVVEPTERDWKPEYATLFKQALLFGPSQKPLEKIPYVFSYSYLCEDPGCKGHKMKIEDWELGKLYLKMRDKFGNEETALGKVKERFLRFLCDPQRDTHFFVGRVIAYGTWIILGVFYPPIVNAKVDTLFK